MWNGRLFIAYEITDEQAERAQEAVKDAVRGEVNRAVFKAKDNVAAVERVLRKYFSRSFQGKKLCGGKYVYRFQAEGITIINTAVWENYLIEYSDLAEIVVMMIENNLLSYDDTTEEVQEEETGEETGEETAGAVNEPQAAVPEPQENAPLPGQQDMSDYPEYVPEPREKGVRFYKVDTGKIRNGTVYAYWKRNKGGYSVRTGNRQGKAVLSGRMGK